MSLKLRFASLLLVLLAPAVLGATPASPADSCASTPLLTELLSPAAQPPAATPEGLSPLEGTLDTACVGYSCDDECAPCGGRIIGCSNGEPICVCWNC